MFYTTILSTCVFKAVLCFIALLFFLAVVSLLAIEAERIERYIEGDDENNYNEEN